MTSDRHIVETVLAQNIEWIDGFTGYLPCPGESMHSKRDGKRHCRVMLNGVPTVSCFHQSCANILSEVNHSLRSALGKAGSKLMKFGVSFEKPKRVETRSMATNLRRLESENRRQEALRLKSTILEGYAKSPEELTASSPDSIPTDPADHWKPFLSLFKEQDHIWIGDKEDSISKERLSAIHSRHGQAALAFQLYKHGKHFLRPSEWAERLLRQPISPFTCPAVFGEGCVSRSNAAVRRRPYLVVESDELTKSEVCAVFNWLQQTLTLRAVVDTAGKSLHGWFDMPPADSLERLKDTLPALGCDPKMFTPSQPCRMPGAIRHDGNTHDNYQKLIHLNLKGATV